jgi:hypothetical protein
LGITIRGGEPLEEELYEGVPLEEEGGEPLEDELDEGGEPLGE